MIHILYNIYIIPLVEHSDTQYWIPICICICTHIGRCRTDGGNPKKRETKELNTY